MSNVYKMKIRILSVLVRLSMKAPLLCLWGPTDLGVQCIFTNRSNYHQSVKQPPGHATTFTETKEKWTGSHSSEPATPVATGTANSGQNDFYLECAKHALCYHAVTF